jgi:uncharacterized circularly permuted ATP-grasp superfamily protein/uncharacterized alpha-E superfamily protein
MGPGVSSTAQLELDMRFEGGLRPELASLVAGYRPDPGVYDELIDSAGEIRSHWHVMLEHLARLGADETRRIFATADRHMRDAGVVHRVYDDPGGVERPWPLSHLPLVIPMNDWRVLANGITQRARLHEELLSDLYGPQKMVAEGVLPAALVAGNREFLRPLTGVTPSGGQFLHIYAADVSRGPDGRWWVLSDRTQAPSGLGYAIENRIALSRAMPDLFRTLCVDRLAGFYQQFRTALAARTGMTDPRIALLTPGPLNETYFEHAYLARCLGFLLVEGGDLTVHSDIVYVRTIEGPKRIDALVRRVDSDFADPLELNTASRLGIPGLVEAVRAGNIILANALGSGLSEAPALGGYLPALSRRLIGEDLLLPNLATWWCGDPAARRHVLATMNDKAILPAFGRTLKGQMDNNGVLGRSLPPSEKARIASLIERRGLDFIGQEPVRLATTPVWDKGRLHPRHYAIRIFASRGPDGWTVMPGGLCRISDRTDARALSMQRGGRSADVWVTGDRPPEMSMLVPNPEDVEINRQTSALPSRAADNLFWLGRYLERADAALRVARSLIGSGHDYGVSDVDESPADRLIAILALWGAVDTADCTRTEAIECAVASKLPGAVPSIIGSAYRTASAIRDRVSPDAWRALNDLKAIFTTDEPIVQLSLAKRVDDRLADTEIDDLAGRIDRGLRILSSLSGLAHENMNRLGGWRFLDLGTRVERAIAVACFARRLTEPTSVRSVALETGSLNSLLELVDAQLAYRGRYLTGPARRPVLDLVMLDVSHPRSVAYQVTEIMSHLDRLARLTPDDLVLSAETQAQALADSLAETDPGAIDADWIITREAVLRTISDAITQRYLSGLPPAVDEKLDGAFEAA